MRLYYSPGACSLAVHIVLREIEADFELVKVNLSEMSTESGEDFAHLNPHGYVPVLKLDDNAVLSEVVAITQYLADQHPDRQLAPKPGTFERTRLHEQLNFLSSELHKAFVPLFHESSENEKVKARKKVSSILAHFDVVLAKSSYLLGERFTVADAYLFVQTGWAKHANIDLSLWQHLSAYCRRIAERDSVRTAMQAEGLLQAAT